MNAKQVAAVVAAVGLIAGAFGVRALLDDDEASADPSATTDAPPQLRGEIVCITELAAVCTALAAEDPELTVRTESAFVTLAALADLTGDDVPTWMTVAPFPAMADSLRATTNRDPLGLASTELAATPLVVAVPATPAGRATAIETTCSANTWRCLGDADSWRSLGVETDQPLAIGIGDAERSVVALASLAAAAAGYFADPGISAATLQADPAFGTWLGRLARSVPLRSLSGGTPLPTLLTRQSAVNAAATTAAELAAYPDAETETEVGYPEPAMWLQAVVAGPADRELPDGSAATATASLVGVGWEPPDAAGPTLPDATTMLALQLLWKDAV